MTSMSNKYLAKPSRGAKQLMQWQMFTMAYAPRPDLLALTDVRPVRLLVHVDILGSPCLV